MSEADPRSNSNRPSLAKTARVIIVSSVMFTFISYWRTAAVVLCDLASTAYYIGGIVEQSIGPAAPLFILAVMLFSYTVRAVYIESSTLFVRGGVYRVVRAALGRLAAKVAVSALMFDFILTGPISGVSAGQYFMNLLLELIGYFRGTPIDKELAAFSAQWGSVIIACLITVYFFRKNLIGIHESSDKALKIMIATTVMAVVLIAWCGVTLWLDGARNSLNVMIDLRPKTNYSATAPDDPPEVDPTGFLAHTGLAADLRERFHGQRFQDVPARDWLSIVGLIGLCMAFGQSILAMSGEETLAQVYREVESPKLKNFKKAAFIIFAYSLILTGGISFLAVLLIPNDVRMANYHDNLIGGLAMSVVGPLPARLLLNAFVVIVGGFILAGAVNTAIIGSNGVLNRVAEDGVMPDWFLRPHPKYGTTYRILWLVVGLQIVTIILSRGKTLLLGEAYAFGVVWSFVFMAGSMVVLRFRDKRPREFKVPLNIRLGNLEVPLGLMAITLVLLFAAIANLLTKELATIGGLIFTGAFFTVFLASEIYHERKRKGMAHQHLEQFNQQEAPALDVAELGLRKPYRKLVAIRSPQNLFMLENTLRELDPQNTDVVVMTAKVVPPGDSSPVAALDIYEQELLTAVVQRAETTGKRVKTLVVPTNNPLYAIARTAHDLGAQELAIGASNKYTADEQFEQLALYWLNLHQGEPAPLTIRLLGRDRDVQYDIAGGNRIPKVSERHAKSAAELHAAGVGVRRVLFVHDETRAASDLLQGLLTMLDPEVSIDLVKEGAAQAEAPDIVEQDMARTVRLGWKPTLLTLPAPEPDTALLHLVKEGKYDLLVLGVPSDLAAEGPPRLDRAYLQKHASCRVFVASPPAIPLDPEEEATARSGPPH